MDWSKAKNILIVVLLATNLILIFTYGFQYENDLKQEDNVYKYTVSILEKNNIYIETPIPERTGRMPVLFVAYDTFDMNVGEEIMKEMPQLQAEHRTEDDYRKAANDFLTKCKLINEYVVCSGVWEDQNQDSGSTVKVVYQNIYKEVPVANCYMTCSFKDGKLVDFKRKWMDPKEEGDTKMEITMPVTALLKFMGQQQGTEEIRIDDMRMTYWVDSLNFNEGELVYDTAFPSWKITYNGKEEYIPAFEQ